MTTRPLIIIDEKTVKQLAHWDWIIEAVEQAFIAQSDKAGEVFPTVLGHGSQPGTILGAKSGVIKPSATNGLVDGLLGIKVGSYWPGNPSHDRPAHGSTTLLLDDQTGFPKALINAHFLNGMRTAAANAIAAKYLSHPQANRLAVFGAGSQARFEVEAIRQVRPIEEVYIVNRNPEKATTFANELIDTGLNALVCHAEQALQRAQLVVTVTASRQALFEPQWIQAGTHLSAMGSDAPGKQEIPPALFEQAALFCDNHTQSTRIGEFQYATDHQKAAVVEIGAVITNKDQHHTEQQITLFDSSGIGLQDVAVASELLRLAEQNNLIKTIDF